MVPSKSESLLTMRVCGCAIWPCMDLARTAPASTTPRMSCMGCAAAGTPRDERGACLPIDADSRGKMRMPTASRSGWDERSACLPIDADVRRALWIRQTSIQIRPRSDQIEPDQTLHLWRKRLGAKKEGAPHRRRPPMASSGGGRVSRALRRWFCWWRRGGLRSRQRDDPGGRGVMHTLLLVLHSIKLVPYTILE
jgi:hypothetical protein